MERLLASLFISYECITEKFSENFKNGENEIAQALFQIVNNKKYGKLDFQANSLVSYVLTGFIYFEQYQFDKSVIQFNNALYYLEINTELFNLLRYKILSIEKSQSRSLKKFEILGKEFKLSENAYITEYDQLIQTILFYFETDSKRAVEVVKKYFKCTVNNFIDLFVYNEKIFFLHALSKRAVDIEYRKIFTDGYYRAKNIQTYKFSLYLFHFYWEKDFLTVKKLLRYLYFNFCDFVNF